ncbi:MAG: glycosyltransferase [Acidobacteriota bacterium]
MLLLFLVPLAVLGYVYGGYPLLLRLVAWVRPARPLELADITPSVSLVISAHNEAAAIKDRIENALALTYPPDRLEIVVVSDASTDGTDDIVSRYAPQGVKVVRQSQRRGKTAGLNCTVPLLNGEIVVFSDANVTYEPDAVLKLVRNFADPTVGCVTGEARYRTGGTSVADIGERAYWNYEIQIKRLETAVGSMVGGDGAIYSIRRSLWRTLPEDAINDFLNPLQIVEAGRRAVYEPAALCYEESAGGMRAEYRRRIRIVSRSWRAVFQAPGVLNPLRVGVFAWALVSHKLLRWLSGPLLVLATVGAIGTLATELRPHPVLTPLALTATALMGATRAGRWLGGMFAYFIVINAASTVGVVKGCLGRVTGVWETPRHRERDGREVGVLVPVGQMFQGVVALTLTGATVASLVMPLESLMAILFWSSTFILVYIYAGYPALLKIWQRLRVRPIRRAPIAPQVCVFITANDEQGVIEAKLRNTLELDYPADRLAIVVASDGSVDDTNEIVRRFAPRVQLLDFSQRRGKTATINDGLKSVTAEIVVFSDANTFLERAAVRTLVRNFADDQVGVVSGDVTLVGERAALAASEDLYYRYERLVQRAESAIGSTVGADGALYAMRHELFVPPPPDTILDDLAIPMGVIRAGRRVVLDPNARALEQGSDSAWEEFARKARVIAGAMQFFSRRDSAVPLSAPQIVLSLVSHKGLRWFSPAFGVCALTTAAVLAGHSPVYATAAVGLSSVLALGVAGCVPRLRRVPPVAIAHYFCLLQAAAAVGFVRGLTGRQSVLWRRFERVKVPVPARVRQ